MRAQSRGESSSISELEWMKFVERRDKYQIQTLIVILKSTTALSKLTGDISIKSVIENNFLAECLSLFLPWPSQKTEPQVLCLFFFLSNIHNMFRHCALITWYLTKNWQKYWQKQTNKIRKQAHSTFTFSGN